MATIRKIEIAYPAVFEEAEEGGYTAYFPDLPGCVTEGDTFEEACDMARDALTGYLASIFTRNMKIPEGQAPNLPEDRWRWIKPRLNVEVPLALRKARKDAGLSQQVVAHRLGITYTSYQRLENPKDWNATFKQVERAFRALDCEVELDIGRFEQEAEEAAKVQPGDVIPPS